MNPTEQRIFEIIRADVCEECPEHKKHPLASACPRHRERCYAGYERQAKKICRQIIQPLEDGLK